MAAKEMRGHRFGLLSVVDRLPNLPGGTAVWLCRCDCGETREIPGTSLRAGRHKSCGCASPRFTPSRLETHGMTKTRTYRIWIGMLSRCSSKNRGKSRRHYFDKGIRVCDRWQSFKNFVEDMGEAPDGLSIDRIDGNGWYEPGNCRWATTIEQGNNTSSNVRVTHDGQTKTIAEWSRYLGVKQNTIAYRLLRGWPVDRALQKQPPNIRTERKEKRARPCPICGAVFIPRTGQLRAGHGKFCSHACQGVFAKALNTTLKRVARPEHTRELTE